MSYFDYPNCSNSSLSKLLKEIRGDDSPLPIEAFRKGTLFDAVVTEPANLDLQALTIRSTGQAFTMDEYRACRRMEAALDGHPVASIIRNNSTTQHEIYDHPLQMEYSGVKFTIPFKAKLDFYWKSAGVVSDLKSTSAASQSAFEESAVKFQYYRQLYLYCQLTGANRAFLLAVNWSAKIFIIEMNRGDESWTLAERQTSSLALLYYLIKM